jgi:hypothetical protein
MAGESHGEVWVAIAKELNMPLTRSQFNNTFACLSVFGALCSFAMALSIHLRESKAPGSNTLGRDHS